MLRGECVCVCVFGSERDEYFNEKERVRDYVVAERAMCTPWESSSDSGGVLRNLGLRTRLFGKLHNAMPVVVS